MNVLRVIEAWLDGVPTLVWGACGVALVLWLTMPRRKRGK